MKQDVGFYLHREGPNLDKSVFVLVPVIPSSETIDSRKSHTYEVIHDIWRDKPTTPASALVLCRHS